MSFFVIVLSLKCPFNKAKQIYVNGNSKMELISIAMWNFRILLKTNKSHINENSWKIEHALEDSPLSMAGFVIESL